MEEIKFPVYKKGIYSDIVVRFDSLNCGEVMRGTDIFYMGFYSNKWADCFNNKVWENVEWVEEKESKPELEQTISEESTESFVNNFEQYGFKGNFDGEILKELDDKLIGCILENGKVYAMEWYKNGDNSANASYHRIHYSKYNLTPIVKEWYEEDYWIFVKDRGENSYPNSPQKKFKFAWTEGMCKNLRESGWRLASDEELELMSKYRNRE